jgi:hypothetical protein
MDNWKGENTMKDRLLPRVTAEDMHDWFRANGGDIDPDYLNAHFERFVAARDFALDRSGEVSHSRLTVLDVGAHWLHNALLLANEGHKLICADIPATIESQPVRICAEAMDADLIAYNRLDLGEGIWSLPESSVTWYYSPRSLSTSHSIR